MSEEKPNYLIGSSKPKFTRITIRLPLSLRKRIREAAAKQDMDMSTFIHMIIQAYFQAVLNQAPK